MKDVPAWINRKGPLQALTWVAIALVVYLVLGGDVRESLDPSADTEVATQVATDSVATIAALRADRAEEVWVTVEVRVQRVLSDDTEGSAHQRFIVALDDESTLLVAHNIDLAERVPLAVDDRLQVRGKYVWNDQGGLLHWTHHDPDGYPGGWIEHEGRRYE